MKELILLNEIARQTAEANKLLDVIANEKLFDNTHYIQTEAKRNTLWEVCRTIERVFGMDPGQADLALKAAESQQRER